MSGLENLPIFIKIILGIFATLAVIYFSLSSLAQTSKMISMRDEEINQQLPPLIRKMLS